MLVFIDESDAGLKLDGNSSPNLIVTLLLFNDHDQADAADKRIGELKRELKLHPNFEFHFYKKTAPVFPVESTEGDELPGHDPELERWINSLPLLEVARSWGLKVDACNGRDHGARGSYTRGKEIALAVTNLSTWAHELIHAADDRLGNLTERGQHWRSETVAELGGAVLLEALGFEQDSDRGGCFEYVQGYAEDAGVEPVQACMDVLKRTCEAVNLLLVEAEKMSILQTAEITTEITQ